MANSDWQLTLVLGAAALNALGIVLAWLAKLHWSKEYGAAKDETIKAKEAQLAAVNQQLENLREMFSPRVKEYFTSQKETLEEFVGTLQGQVADAKVILGAKDKMIADLQASDIQRESQIKTLAAERKDLAAKVAKLEKAAHEIRRVQPGTVTRWLDDAVVSSTTLNNSLSENLDTASGISPTPTKSFFTARP